MKNTVSAELQKQYDALSTEAKFRLSRDIIQIILDCNADGVIVTDGEGNVLMLNESAKEGAENILDDIAARGENLIGLNVHTIVDRGYWSDSACAGAISSLEETNIIQVIDNYREVLTTARVFIENGKPIFAASTERYMPIVEGLNSSLREARSLAEKYWAGIEYYRKNAAGANKLIYKSDIMDAVVENVLAIAKRDSSVLMQGESGTGKEVIADLIHSTSPRAEGPFIKVNCGAIPETLFESEFFGYEGGAFTGASPKGKPGYFELANGGTLFMDEIGDLPIPSQVKLLRVLQEKEILHVGGDRQIPVDVRIIAATNVDLTKKVQEGTFREDLYYRLNIVPISVPPLRERREDISELLFYFLDEFNKKYKTQIAVNNDIVSLFERYDWPGNVRELSNVVERLVVTSEDGIIPLHKVASFIDPSLEVDEDHDTSTLQGRVEAFEKSHIVTALSSSRSCSEAAGKLGISDSALSKKMKKYGLTLREAHEKR